MMNMKTLLKLCFLNTAVLTNMAVAFPGSVRLTFPVRPVVVLSPSSPRWIIFSAHSCPVSNIEALVGTVVVLTNCILFPHELFFTSSANNFNLCIRRSNNSFCTLPSTTALPAAKVVLPHCARCLLEVFPAPIAYYIQYVFCALGRAIDLFYSPDTPERGVKFFSARWACFSYPFRFVSGHRSIITDRCRAVNGAGSEMIGAHLAGWEEIVGIEMEQEYVEIAEARLKHWTTSKGFTERSLIDNEPCY